MTKTLERRWWFEAICCAGAVLIVQWLEHAAGIAPTGFSIAKLLVWCCCFFTVERALSFALWLLVLVVAPGKVIGKTGRPR